MTTALTGGHGLLTGQPLGTLGGRGTLTAIISISGASASESFADWIVNGGNLRPGVEPFTYGQFIDLLNSF
jgi:hypothetical protein